MQGAGPVDIHVAGTWRIHGAGPGRATVGVPSQPLGVEHQRVASVFSVAFEPADTWTSSNTPQVLQSTVSLLERRFQLSAKR